MSGREAGVPRGGCGAAGTLLHPYCDACNPFARTALRGGRGDLDPPRHNREGHMFHDRLRALIERNCQLIREQSGEVGEILARCDPHRQAVDPHDLAAARRACGQVCDRAAAIGLAAVEDRARILDTALGVLQARDRIEPWNMAEVMSLEAKLAAVVDRLQPEDSALYTECTAPEALEVAPLPAEAFA